MKNGKYLGITGKYKRWLCVHVWEVMPELFLYHNKHDTNTVFHERRCTPLPCLNLNWQKLKNGKFRDKLCCITFVTRSTALTNLDLFFGGKIDWSCWQQTSFSLPCWSHLSKLTKRILFQNYARCPIIDQNRRSVIKISISKMTIYQISLHLQRRIQDFPEGGANPKKGVLTYCWPKFAENCMKMKNIGPGGRSKFYYVDPPLIYLLKIIITFV